MGIRIVQWNICNRSKAEKIAEFIDSIKLNGVTVFCLQEVLERSHQTLIDILQPTWSEYSLRFREPGRHEGLNRRLGVAVLAFGIETGTAKLIERTVFPERSLDCVLDWGDVGIHVSTFHSLTGVDYKRAKSSNFACIADFLVQTGADMDFLCFDANEPKVDSVDASKREFYDNGDKGKNAALILGENKVHDLEDSLLIYMKNIGATVDTNPVAVSHLTKGIERRYDYILSSKRWSVMNVEYQLETALGATSDHAAVIGDFELLRDSQDSV